MNKKRNAFTLIELLAIIVILAIIAVITVPIIINIIEKSKKDAAVASVRSVESAVKYSFYNGEFKDLQIPEGFIYNCSVDGCYSNYEEFSGKLMLNGGQPVSGSIYVDTDGDVSSIHNLVINGYICNKASKEAKIVCRTSDVLTLSYDLNGGSGNSCSSKKVTYGGLYGDLCDGSNLVAPQYKEFDGWWTSKDGGLRITNNNVVSEFDDITLYAHWKAGNVGLNVVKGVGIESISTPSNCILLESEPPTYNYDCTYDSVIDLFDIAQPLDGYDAPIWTSNEVSIVDDKFILSSDNVVLNVSAPLKQYTITLDNQGAIEFGSESINVTYTEAIPQIAVPTKKASTFQGYYTEINGGGTKYINADGSSARDWDIPSSMTLYAYWELNNGIVPSVLYGNFEDGENTILAGGIVYDVRILNIYDGQAGDDDGSVNGVITISSNKEYGDEADVGTLDSDASRMMIVKYHANVVIESGVTVTSVKSSDGYGGPKGMYLCSTGNIINNGTISMTARGAKAVGENVYLYTKDLENWEFVPGIGASPGSATSISNNSTSSYSKMGAAGNNASTITISPRATGGGGQGGARKTNNTGTKAIKGGLGSAGTSYSGGSGGGGATQNNTNTATTGVSASANGGAGGKGVLKNSGGAASAAGGGAGNPGGAYHVDNPETSKAATLNTMKGASGTGGLLIIYGEGVTNNGTISSNGSAGGLGNSSTILGSDDYPKSSGGGGSGGGSINIFYRNEYISSESASITCSGGAGGYGGTTSATGATRASGGAGGTGSYNITQVDI